MLSAVSQVEISVVAIADGEDLNVEMTRVEFEELCKDLFKQCIDKVEEVLDQAKMPKD